MTQLHKQRIASRFHAFLQVRRLTSNPQQTPETRRRIALAEHAYSLERVENCLRFNTVI